MAVLAAGSADSLSLEAACWIAGVVVVPLHPGMLAAEAIALCRAARVRALFVDGSGGDERVAALASGRKDLPDLHHLVLLAGGGAVPAGVDGLLSDLLEGGETPDLEARARERRPGDPAALVFSAGTTGPPRATPISHGAQVAAARALAEAVPLEAGPAVSLLSPSEPVQRTFAALCLLQGIPLALSGPLSGPPGRDGEGRDLTRSLTQLGPRTLVASPETLRLAHGPDLRLGPGRGGLRRRAFRWAVATGRRSAPRRMAGESPSGLALRVADRLVFSRLRGFLGGRIETALCSGPLTPGWTGFLWAVGVPVFECYGLAEAASPLASNRPGRVRPGTAGVPLPGVEIRIAPGGEILARGPSVAGDGGLATGDAGRLDDDGFLEVYGPKAHALAGAGGAPAHPGPVETAFRAGHFFSQALVVAGAGDGLAALLAPDLEALGAWGRRRGLEVDGGRRRSSPTRRSAG